MQPSATNHPITWFKNEDQAGTLELSPPFQRRPVWDEETESYLIDTILSDLPVPEIYIRATTSSDGKTVHDVVDGQQRTRAVLKFAYGDLRLVGPDVSAKWQGKTISDLLKEDDKLVKRFWAYKIVVREIGEATDQEVRDLFRRLNINAVVLNDQELRHAKYKGHFLKLSEALADDEWWVKAGIITVGQVRRMLDVEFVSELLVGLMAGPQEKKKTLDDFYDDYESAFPDEERYSTLFKRTRSLIQEVLNPDQLYEWTGRSDFYTIFLAFGKLAEKDVVLTAAQRKRLAQDLTAFQKDVTQAKKKDNEQKFAKKVHQYAEAVSRAASDVDRRGLRQDIVDKLIARVVKPTKSRKKKAARKTAKRS